MDAETFRWLIAIAFAILTGLFSVMWKSLEDVKDMLRIDMRALDMRITRIETHLKIGVQSPWNNDITHG